MEDNKHARWRQMHSRGRADCALRYGLIWSSVAWLAHAIFGDWAGARELILYLCFLFTFFVGVVWFAFWPILDSRMRRSLEPQVPHDRAGD